MKGTASRLRRCTALLASFIVLSVLATAARAADPVTDQLHAAPHPDGSLEITARERASTRTFYGWQILATGEAGGVVAALAMVLPESPLKTLPSTAGFLVGMPFYVLGGPATHWTHGDFQKGLVSLGGNFALPVVSGFIGQGIRCAPSDAPIDCGTSGFIGGFAIALATVPLVDALVLGWETTTDDDPVMRVDAQPTDAPTARARRDSRLARASRVTIVPAWSVGPKGDVSLGFSGRF